MAAFDGAPSTLRAAILAVLRAHAPLADDVSDEPPDVAAGEPDTRLSARVFVGVGSATMPIPARRDPSQSLLYSPTVTIRSWHRRQPDRIRAAEIAHSYDAVLDRAALLMQILSDPALGLSQLAYSLIAAEGWYRLELTGTAAQASLPALS